MLRQAGRLLHEREQFIQVDWFGEIIQGAVAHRTDCFPDVSVGSDEQNRQRGVQLPRPAQCFQSR